MFKPLFLFTFLFLVNFPAITSSVKAAMASTVVEEEGRAEEEFQKAWRNPSYTAIEVEPLDINHLLSHYYITEPKLIFTKKMLWDLEQKKAWNPERYIGSVVEKGSGKSWQKKELKEGNLVFVRSTKQRQWLNNQEYGDVFEKVFLNNAEQRVTFLGVSSLENEAGALVEAKNPQPLFHVEHGVSGTEERPLNTWRIVHLTKEKNEELIKVFQEIFKDKTSLPSYMRYYIENDLGVSLKRKENIPE